MSRDHGIKNSHGFEGWVPTASYYSAKFGGHRYCGSADIGFYICQLTTSSKGHLTRYVGSSNSKLPVYQF